MTEELFTNRLKELTRRASFVPFLVKLVDGRQIVVDYPSVAFSDGVAGFISETDDLIPFTCDEVQEIVPAAAEVNP